MKFAVYAEGSTEKASLRGFLSQWLNARLPQPIGINLISLGGWSRFRKEIPRKVHTLFSGRSGDDVIAAIGLMDLYAPGYYPAGVDGIQQRYAWGKADIENDVGHAKFTQHFAVHETEAWLLSDPSIFPAALRAAVQRKAAHPESVNFNEPPSRFLAATYRRIDQRYDKVKDGTLLFAKLSPETAASRCPSLQRLLDDMLQRAKAAIGAT